MSNGDALEICIKMVPKKIWRKYIFCKTFFSPTHLHHFKTSCDPEKSCMRSPQESQSKQTRSCTKVIESPFLFLLFFPGKNIHFYFGITRKDCNSFCCLIIHIFVVFLCRSICILVQNPVFKLGKHQTL